MALSPSLDPEGGPPVPKKSLISIAMATAAWLGVRPAAAELQVGDVAPDFELAGSDGATHSLSQYKDKQGVVLAWFPKAFTPG